MAHGPALTIAVCLATLVTGCAAPPPVTEIFLVVDTDMAVRDGQTPDNPIEVIRLELFISGSPPRTGFTARLDEGYADHLDPPVSWGLLAVSAPERELDVIVRGYARLAPGEPDVVEKWARVQFVPGEVRVLCVDLMDACAGVECTGETTCHVDDAGSASCVSVHVDEDRLPVYQDEVACPDGWPAL